MDPNLLILQDSLKRFCTEAGKHPIIQVKFGEGNTRIIGVFDTDTVDSQGVAAIPPAPQQGTYDVLIQTPPDCKGDPPPTFVMPKAVTYGGG